VVRQMNPDLKRIPGVDYNFSQNIEDNVEEAMSSSPNLQFDSYHPLAHFFLLLVCAALTACGKVTKGVELEASKVVTEKQPAPAAI